eukprot:5287834-Pleurochrysis_carterae.AAC.4
MSVGLRACAFGMFSCARACAACAACVRACVRAGRVRACEVACVRAWSQELARAFPRHAIIGEEASAKAGRVPALDERTP